MRFVEPDGDKKGLICLPGFIDPLNEFTGNNLGGIAVHFPQSFSIQKKVFWILVTGSRNVPGGQPVVIPVIIHTRLFGVSAKGEILILFGLSNLLLIVVAQVPLAKMGRLITFFS